MKKPGRKSPAKPAKAVRPETLRLNAILVGLEGPAALAAQEAASLVELSVRDRIYEANGRIDYAYFPIDSVLSVVTQMKDGNSIEVGTIGCEGTSAIPLLLGGASSANECYCQVPGMAIKIGTDVFQSLRTGKKFRQLLDRYVQSYVNMLGQLAACNRLHNVYERCARWLLMSHDRVGTDELRLTHEYLGMMLGTQRSGVTIAAATLQHAGFIRYARGVITILDRPGLEDASCECYEVARAQFSGLLRSIGPVGRNQASA